MTQEFARQLGRRVRRTRQRYLLSLRIWRQVIGSIVDGSRRGEDEPQDLVASHRIQQFRGSANVRSYHFSRVAERGLDPRPRREVNDCIERDVREQALEQDFVPYVALDQPERVRSCGDFQVTPLDLRIVVRIEIVEIRYPSSSSLSHRWEPMNPAAPVTRIRPDRSPLPRRPALMQQVPRRRSSRSRSTGSNAM